MTRTAIHFFLVILGASLLCSLLGGLFGWTIAAISPDFVIHLFFLGEGYQGVAQYAFSMGMVWGLFIGASVAGFSCLLATIYKIIRLRIEWNKSGSPL